MTIRTHDVNRRTHRKPEQFKCVRTFQTEILCYDKIYFRMVTSACPVLSEYGARCRSDSHFLVNTQPNVSNAHVFGARRLADHCEGTSKEQTDRIWLVARINGKTCGFAVCWNCKLQGARVQAPFLRHCNISEQLPTEYRRHFKWMLTKITFI